MNWLVLTAGKGRTVYDLVVQAAQRAKDLRVVQIEVPAIPLVSRLNEPDCAFQHQDPPDSAQEERPLTRDRLKAASPKRPRRSRTK